MLTKNHASKDAVSESKVKSVKLASLAEMEKMTERSVDRTSDFAYYKPPADATDRKR